LYLFQKNLSARILGVATLKAGIRSKGEFLSSILALLDCKGKAMVKEFISKTPSISQPPDNKSQAKKQKLRRKTFLISVLFAEKN